MGVHPPVMSDELTASLGYATGTRLDSGCKHIQQCKVSQDHMVRLSSDGAEGVLRRKYQFAVHKDELVLGVGKEWSKSPAILGNNAYPRVVSNLGEIGDEEQKLIKFVYHNVTSLHMRQEYLKAFNHEPTAQITFDHGNYIDPQIDSMSLSNIFDCVCVGYANTVGFAHRETGDTLTSVMIGGLRTVRNGDFPVMCGDIIQWYWPFERDCFSHTGARKTINTIARAGHVITVDNTDPAHNLMAAGGLIRPDWDRDIPGADKRRKVFFERQYGNIPKKGKSPGHSKLVPFIKPYIVDEDNERVWEGGNIYKYTARPAADLCG